jgi:hypothetical protein
LIVSKSQADFTSHAGLGLGGVAIRQRTKLATDAAAAAPVRRDAMRLGNVLAN